MFSPLEQLAIYELPTKKERLDYIIWNNSELFKYLAKDDNIITNELLELILELNNRYVHKLVIVSLIIKRKNITEEFLDKIRKNYRYQPTSVENDGYNYRLDTIIHNKVNDARRRIKLRDNKNT